MPVRIFTIVGVLAVSYPLLAQSGEALDRPPPGMLLTSLAAEDAVIAGRSHMMAFRLDAAEKAFQALLREPGNDEAAQYHLTAISFLTAMFDQREPSYDVFFDRSDTLMDLLDDGDDSAWRYFFIAENYLMRAFAQARRGDFLRSAVSARQSYEVYLDALRADPTLIDAESGIGLLKAMIGATPPSYKRFLKMFGYRGTIEEGIILLDHASVKAKYNKDQAALFRDLTQVYMNKDRDDATERLGVRYHNDKNPASGLFYAFALRFSRRQEEAVDVAKESIRLGEQAEFMQLPFLYFHLGSALFALNRFDEAAVELQNYLQLHGGQSYQATAQVELGLSLEMLGRRPEAEEIYRQIVAPTDFDIDLAAEREAAALLKSPLSGTQKALLRGRNLLSSGRLDEAVPPLDSVFVRPDATEAERTEAAYWLGRAHHVAGDLDKAESMYAYVRLHPEGKDLRWAPWATYYLGKIRQSEGMTKQAKKRFEEVLDFRGDYDFRKSLRRNARLAIDNL